MNQHTSRPTLAATTSLTRPNPISLLDKVLEQTARSGFDAEAFHVMQDRDNALIADEVMNGSGSSKFVYQFAIAGTNVTGISVVGARHLATEYGGLKHRMVASTRKIGALFTFTSYPADGSPMRVSCSVIPELAAEDDFYSALVEISDIKLGNTIQMEASETREEKRRDGSKWERPHFQKIAQAKAYRNAVLALIPQDVQLAWKEKMLALGKSDIVTRSVIAEKRAGVLQFAAAKGIPVDRHTLESLTMDQIAGLAEAARTKDAAQFTNSAAALGLIQVEVLEQPEQVAAAPESAATSKPRQARAPKPEPTRAPEPPHDPETGEIEREAAPEEPPPFDPDTGEIARTTPKPQPARTAAPADQEDMF